MAGQRAARKLAREVVELRETQEAMARAPQLAWSSVPVDVEGVEVQLPVPELLQEGVAAASVAASAAAAANAAEAAASAAAAHVTELETTKVDPLSGSVTLIVADVGAAQETATAALTGATAANAQASELSGRVGAVESAVDDQVAVITAVEASQAELAEQVAQQAMYYAFTPTGMTIGIPGAEVGNQLHIDNDSVTFLDQGDPTLWLSDGVVHATRFEGDVVALGKHQFEKDGTTGTIIRAL